MLKYSKITVWLVHVGVWLDSTRAHQGFLITVGSYSLRIFCIYLIIDTTLSNRKLIEISKEDGKLHSKVIFALCFNGFAIHLRDSISVNTKHDYNDNVLRSCI